MRSFYLILLAIITPLGVCVAQSDPENRRLAVVISVKGNATYSAGSVQNAKLRAGLSLPAGTRIITSPESTVDLYFRQIGSMFRLMPRTDLVLEKLDRRTQNGQVLKETVARLEEGRVLVRARLLVPQSIFEIRTKTSAFSVPNAGVGRYDIRADGSVVVGKKSQLPVRVVNVPAAVTNVIGPSEIFDPTARAVRPADSSLLEELLEQLSELDDLARALTPPLSPEEGNLTQ